MKNVMTNLVDKELLSAMDKIEQKDNCICIFWSSCSCEGEAYHTPLTGASGNTYYLALCEKHDNHSSHKHLKSVL